MTGKGVYGATKKFNDFWAEYVYYEYGGEKLDVYCLKPGVVITNIH